MMSPAARKEAARWAQIEKDDPDFALLHYAEIGHLGKVRKLLKAGADPDTKQSIDTGIESVTDTPLYAAAGAGHLDVAAALIAAGAAVDIEADEGWRPIHHAALNGQHAMVALLIQEGADMNRREELQRQTPLHIASSRGDDKTVSVLVAAGAARDVEDTDGLKPVEVICSISGAKDTEKKEKRSLIRGIFQAAADRDALREKTARQALTILQKDVVVAKLPSLRHRRPR